MCCEETRKTKFTDVIYYDVYVYFQFTKLGSIFDVKIGYYINSHVGNVEFFRQEGVMYLSSDHLLIAI